MKKERRIILNALIVASITFLSSLIAAGYPPTIETLYTGAIGFALAFLTQARELVGENPPKLGLLI